MLDNVENTVSTPAPAPSSPAKKGRGRPAKIGIAAKETPQQRVDRIKGELQKAEEAQKLAEQHQAAIVGAVVVRHARADDNFRRQIAALLRADVKNKTDFAAIAELLG